MKPQVDRTYRESHALQWVREALINAKEAGAARVHFGIEWQGVKSSGVYRRVIADDGSGIALVDHARFFNTFGGGGKPIGGPHENYGIGFKTSVLPWNKFGVLIISLRDGQQSVSRIYCDREADEYGMQSPTTLGHELRLDLTCIVPEFVRTAGHGTVIVLLGNEPAQDTILGDPDRPVESNVDAIVKYINCRFWELKDIEVTVDVVFSSEKTRWPGADAPKSGGGRSGTWTTFRPLGMLKSTIDRETENSRLAYSGTVPLARGLVQADWYLREGDPLPHARAQGKGFVASLYRGEIYGLSDHAATMRSFGIGAIRNNAFLVLRPREASDSQDGVYPDTSRTGLKFGGEAGGVDLPMSDWAQEFASNLPEPIIAAIKRSFTSKDGEFVDNEWKSRLQERYGLKWRIPKLLATPRGADLSTPIQPTGQSGRKRRRTLLSRIFPEKKVPAGSPRLGDREREGDAADEKQVSGGLPDFRIVGEAEIGDNGKWAIASFSPPNNVDRSGLVLINRDHRIIVHHVREVAKRYPSHLEDVVREELLKVYGEVAVAHVAHSEQMRKLTSAPRVDTIMRSDESLTMALLGLWQIETILMPRLQGKLQKSKGRSDGSADA